MNNTKQPKPNSYVVKYVEDYFNSQVMPKVNEAWETLPEYVRNRINFILFFYSVSRFDMMEAIFEIRYMLVTKDLLPRDNRLEDSDNILKDAKKGNKGDK